MVERPTLAVAGPAVRLRDAARTAPASLPPRWPRRTAAPADLHRCARGVAYHCGMARAYDVNEVESKWQQRWADEGTYEVDNDDPRREFYVLCMYPYPSGPAHQGHVRNYTFGDLLVRYRTMLGHAVLSARSASTPSACRPRTPPSRPGPTPGSSPTPASPS